MAKKTKQVKTNAMRILDEQAVSYTVHEYEAHDNAGRDLGIAIAKELGEDVDQAFKTLVLTSEGRDFVVACISVAQELDLKKLAAVSKHKSLSLLPIRDLEKVTGYIRGGCSPVGMKKLFPVYIDETAQLFDTIIISAGRPGSQLELSPEVLKTVVQAEFVDICHE